MDKENQNHEQWDNDSFKDIFPTTDHENFQETEKQKVERNRIQDGIFKESAEDDAEGACGNFTEKSSFTDVSETPNASETGDHKPAPVHEGREKRESLKNFSVTVGIAAMITLVFVGLVVFYTHRVRVQEEAAKENATTISRVEYTQSEEQKKDTPDIASIAKEAQKSVALITTKDISVTYGMFFQPTEQETEGAGSGVIISDDGKNLYILTNYHVIENSSAGITVTLNDGAQREAAVKGSDRGNDIALLEVKAGKDIDASKIAAIKVGKSADVEIGDSVVAIGNALGYGNSVTSGIISAKDREIEADAGTKLTVIQTDAAINPGNSGGALLDANGNLIGINTAKLSSSYVEGMGYAIPSDTAVKIAEDILAGRVDDSEPGYLGIGARDVDEETAEMYGIRQGVIVGEVMTGGGAYMAGLQQGDVITKADRKRVKSMDDLKEALNGKKKGEAISVTLYRRGMGGYEKMKTEVTLGSYMD